MDLEAAELGVLLRLERSGETKELLEARTFSPADIHVRLESSSASSIQGGHEYRYFPPEGDALSSQGMRPSNAGYSTSPSRP